MFTVQKVQLTFSNLTWLDLWLAVSWPADRKRALTCRPHVPLNWWRAVATRCIRGNVADVVFDGSVLVNADRNLATCPSQVSSPTAPGREAVVTF